MAEKQQYTKPKLRERLKNEITAGSKGGKPGQWSARKAQLLVTEYEKNGGGYESGGRKGNQKHLKQWEQEEWTTADGKKAQKSDGTMDRYLPKRAWEQMAPAEKERTRKRKQQTSKQSGKQYVSNTGPAKQARRNATQSKTRATPSQLVDRPAREVISSLGDYDKRQLRSIRTQEEKKSNRLTVLKAIDKQLA